MEVKKNSISNLFDKIFLKLIAKLYHFIPNSKLFSRIDTFDYRKAFFIKSVSVRGLCVDIGSGKGKYKRYFDDYLGLDLLRELKPDIVGDFHKLPFKDNIAEIVLLFDVLEHTTNYGILLEEAKRIAKDKAKIIISTLYTSGASIITDPEHKHCYNEELLRRALTSHGYRVLEIKRISDIIYAICEVK